jgi:hypothetical protein
VAAVEAGASGILHLTQGETNWCGLAREIAEVAGLDPARVKPCTSDEHHRPARRPINGVLDSERTGGLELRQLPSYRPSLRRAVRASVELQVPKAPRDLNPARSDVWGSLDGHSRERQAIRISSRLREEKKPWLSDLRSTTRTSAGVL